MRRFIALSTLLLLLGACGGTDTTTVIATVADEALAADGLEPGSPLAGAELRFYVGDDVVLETTLDADGRAEVDLEGRYTVQVDLPLSDGECFWGQTLFDVDFPSDRLELLAWQICPG